jgi:hypothetical protein
MAPKRKDEEHVDAGDSWNWHPEQEKVTMYCRGINDQEGPVGAQVTGNRCARIGNSYHVEQ